MNTKLKELIKAFGKEIKAFGDRIIRMDSQIQENLKQLFGEKHKILVPAVFFFIFLWSSYFSFYGFFPIDLDMNLLVLLAVSLILLPFFVGLISMFTGIALAFLFYFSRKLLEEEEIPPSIFWTFALLASALWGLICGITSFLYEKSLISAIGFTVWPFIFSLSAWFSIRQGIYYAFMTFLALLLLFTPYPVKGFLAYLNFLALSINNSLASKGIVCVEKTYVRPIEKMLCFGKCETVNDLLDEAASKKFKCYKDLIVVWKTSSTFWLSKSFTPSVLPIPRKAFLFKDAIPIHWIRERREGAFRSLYTD